METAGLFSSIWKPIECPLTPDAHQLGLYPRDVTGDLKLLQGAQV